MGIRPVMAIVMAFGLAGVAAAQDKAAGPYGLPTFEQFKEKVKPSDDEAKKVEEIYAAATKNEAESKARAKENGTDNKTLQGYMATAKNETINKIKEAIDKEKHKAFNDLLLSSTPDKKKKK